MNWVRSLGGINRQRLSGEAGVGHGSLRPDNTRLRPIRRKRGQENKLAVSLPDQVLGGLIARHTLIVKDM